MGMEYVLASCFGKQGFTGPDKARSVIKRMGRHDARRPGKLHAYRCTTCHQWHIGSDNV